MRSYLFLLALVASAGLSAQAEQFIDSINLSGLPLQIVVEDVTQTPIVVQQYSYVGLDPASGDSLWSVERKVLAGIAQKMSDDYDDMSDLVDIPDVPFIFVNGIVVDVRNGEKIVNEAAEAKLFLGSTLLADQDLVLVELSVKGGTRLYGFSVADGTQRFVVPLKEKGGLGLAGNRAEDAGRAPQALPDGNVLYFDKQNMYNINLNSGTLNWKYVDKVAEARVLEDGQHLLLLSPPSGLMTLADYGKEIQILDLASGAPLYKKKPLKLDGNVKQVVPYDGGLAVIHTDGMNIYDLDGDTDGRWKKDFKEGGIKHYEMQDDQMMVYFKNKRMLVDPATGEEQMKKAEKLDRPAWAGSQPKATFTFAGQEILVWGSNAIQIGAKKHYFSNIAFDAANNRIVMMELNKSNSDPAGNSYHYKFKVLDPQTGSLETLENFIVKSGIWELDVMGDQVSAMSNDGMTYLSFDLSGEEPKKGPSRYFKRLTRKGAKSAKKLARLLGGSDEEEVQEGIPGHISGDHGFYTAVRQPDFSAEDYRKDAAKFSVLIGVPRDKMLKFPQLVVMDKKTGEEVMSEFLVFDNSQFSLDHVNNVIYVIHGKSVRWYQL